MSRRAHLVNLERASELAPQAPPCFSSQDAWVDFVAQAAESVDDAVNPIKVVRIGNKQERIFNPLFAFCADCMEGHRVKMRAQDRCRPNWLAPLVEAA